MASSGSGPASGSGGGGLRPPSSVPEAIDHYRVVKRIGRGGQGDVFLGHDPNLDIDVAIKVLLSDFRTDEFVDRFKVEARTAVRLTAPNIVRVYNFNPAYPYIVMEYCGDGDLNRVIKSRPRMPLSRSLGLIRQVAEGLVIAHEHDPPILHRDLKPANVLFNREVPKVADFGLAKVLSGATSGLTTTRGMMGTVSYCSPEQLRDASSVDSRTDIWSLGVMLYELLTYTRPFEKPGDDYVNVAIKVRTEPPADPPFEIPAPVWSVVQRSLEKDRDKRFGTAREMVGAIDNALRSVPRPDELLLPPEDALAEIDRLAAQAADMVSSGSMEQAETLVRKMRELSLEHSLPRYWNRQIRAIREHEETSDSTPTLDLDAAQAAKLLESRLNSIRGLIVKREYREARRQVGELMIQDPDNSTVHQYLERITREETELVAALNQAHEEAQQARQSGDMGAVREVWWRLDERFPDHPDVKAELAVAERELELQRRNERRDAAKAAAHRLGESGDLDAAIAVWDAFVAEFPDDGEATEALEAIRARRQEKAQAQRLETTAAQAEQLLRDGKREKALELWEACLSEDPGAEVALLQVETLRGEIAAERKATRLRDARDEASGREGAGDLAGALTVWQSLLREVPGEPEAVREADRLRAELARLDRAVRAEKLRGRAADFEFRVTGGRYAAVADAGRDLPEAIQAALRAVDDPQHDLKAAEQQLEEAGRAAEDALSSRLEEGRAALRGRLAEAGEVLSTEAGPEATPGEAALDTAVDRAMGTLCLSWPPEAKGDPVTALSRAGEELHEAVDAVARERGEAVARAREVAAAELTRAEETLHAVAASLQPEESKRLAEELSRLRGQLDSRATQRLTAVADDARGLAAEAGSAVAEARWKNMLSLQRLAEEGLSLLRHAKGAKLDALLSKGGEALAGGSAIESGELARLCDELRAETAACRKRIEAAETRARERWTSASGRWSKHATDDTLRGEAAEITAGGDQALAVGRFDEIDGLARRLDSLSSRAELGAVWERHRETVAAVEGPLGSDGLPGSLLESGRVETLERYRAAVARGAAGDLEPFSAALKKERKARPKKGRAAATGGPREVPAVGGRARRLNQRLQPGVLRAFDEAAGRFAKARSAEERARLGAEMLRAHRRLVPPGPLWPRVVAVGAAVLVVAGLAWLLPGGRAAEQTVPVVLLSSAGEVGIGELTRDGRPVGGVAGALSTVSEQGVRLDLSPGSYFLRTGDGREVSFEVPGQRTVVLGGGEADFAAELIRELELSDLAAPGTDGD